MFSRLRSFAFRMGCLWVALVLESGPVRCFSLKQASRSWSQAGRLVDSVVRCEQMLPVTLGRSHHRQRRRTWPRGLHLLLFQRSNWACLAAGLLASISNRALGQVLRHAFAYLTQTILCTTCQPGTCLPAMPR